MKESEKSYSDIFEKLLKFANNYFNEYLEFIDEYVRDEDDIKAIADVCWKKSKIDPA